MPLAVAPEWRDKLNDLDCQDLLDGMHLRSAPMDTPAAQWACRVRLATAYAADPAFRDYLEARESREEMMCALVNHISMQGLRHVSPNNRQPLLWNEVVDYVRRDVRRLWTLRNGGEFDAYLSEKFDMVCKQDFDDKQKIRGIAGAAEVPTATWCIQWPHRVRATSLPGAWSSQMLFDLIRLEQLERVAILAPAKAAKEARAQRARSISAAV